MSHGLEAAVENAATARKRKKTCVIMQCVFSYHVQCRYTGYQKNGGFADYCVANASFCFPIPSHYSPLQAAPLLCAGLIGYRSLRKTGSPKTLGLYGFGSSAHIIIQVANSLGIQCYVFTRDGDAKKQAFARKLGAVWAGGSTDAPPVLLDACIIFPSEGSLVVAALRAIKKGGKVVCAVIHMTDIPSFAYDDLWNEKQIESVANLTVQDGKEFFDLVSKDPINVTTNCYRLEQVNDAIDDLRHGRLTGSAVLVVDESLLCPVCNKHKIHIVYLEHVHLLQGQRRQMGSNTRKITTRASIAMTDTKTRYAMRSVH